MKTGTTSILRKIFAIAALAAAVPGLGALSISLDTMPQEYQEETNWCWAGCSQSILAYYGTTQTQTSIAAYGTQGYDVANYLWGSAPSETPPKEGIDQILSYFAGLSTGKYSTYLSQTEVETQLAAGLPFVIRWGWTSGGGHFVVGKGISDSYMELMDPSYGPTTNTYDWVKSGDSHTWTHTLTVTSTPPEPVTSITSKPSSPTTSTSATFVYAADKTGSSFSYQIDSGSWSTYSTATTTSFSSLATGSHTFNVKAKDKYGYVDSTPATYTWYISGGTTTITSGPATLTSSTSATFTYSSPLTSPTFATRIDSGVWSSYSSATTATYTGLADGAHVFEVKTKDSSGTEQSDIPSYSWTVDTVPPSPAALQSVTVLSSAAMTCVAQTATDTHGVEYRFIYESWNSASSSWVAVATTSWQSSASVTLTSLSPNTKYHFRVDVRDSIGNMNSGAFDATLLKYTRAPVPSGASASGASTSSISLTAPAFTNDSEASSGYVWTALPLTGYTGHGATTRQYTDTGLDPNTPYAYGIAYKNGDGTATAVSTVTAYTLAYPPASLQWTSVWTTSATISWAANGNPSGTYYQISQWTTSASTTTTSTINLTAGVSISAGTTNYLTIRAYNGDSTPTAYTATISTYIAATTHQITPGTEAVIDYGPGRVTVPQYTFGETVNMTVTVPSSVPSDNSNMSSISTSLSLSIIAKNTAGAALQPQKNMVVRLSYSGYSLGGRTPDSLVVARYDDTHGIWVSLNSWRDSSAQTVSAYTDHLSLFQLMSLSSSSGLGGVTVGPNPLRPVRNAGQKMTFRNLTSDARLRFYTYGGELVKDLHADSTGVAAWDGKNDAGQMVASGVYIVLIEGGGSSTTLKVVVEK